MAPRYSQTNSGPAFLHARANASNSWEMHRAAGGLVSRGEASASGVAACELYVLIDARFGRNPIGAVADAVLAA